MCVTYYVYDIMCLMLSVCAHMYACMQMFMHIFTATSLGVNLLDTLAVEDHASTGASEGLVCGRSDNILHTHTHTPQ